MLISAIMPSCLSPYPHCADRQEERFVFAVQSFLKQSYNNSELIIVSDGCEKTNKIYERDFSDNPRIKIYSTNKQSYFSGNLRNLGIEKAQGDLICYLDADDFIGENHLKLFAENYDQKCDFCYYDDYLFVSFSYGANKFYRRSTKISGKMRFGTSSIVHKKTDVVWRDGYGHDHQFIKDMVEKGYPYKKIKTPEYFVCHFPDGKECFNLDNPRMLF